MKAIKLSVILFVFGCFVYSITGAYDMVMTCFVKENKINPEANIAIYKNRIIVEDQDRITMQAFNITTAMYVEFNHKRMMRGILDDRN